jgi:CheY-like chemotaxis protein
VNARDAMPGGGQLTIAAHPDCVRHDRPGGLSLGHYIRLSVIDTGIGMDADTLKRAIEPFFSTKGVGKGTGLGLSMVHGLAAQLGGELTIESAPGAGSTVTLWLPMSVSEADRATPALHLPTHGTALGTVLVVDDEDLVRMSTADMLVDLGYKVVEARSAEAALTLIDDGLEPDVVVTDHLMPGLSGAQLAHTLKASRPSLSVLIVSGYAEEEGIDASLPRLTKPFRAAELAASLMALSPRALSHAMH